MSSPQAIEQYVLKINEKSFHFEVYLEENLSWKKHQQIHEALNLAYGARTAAFTKKTFAYRPPILRILASNENRLVAHTAIFEDYALLDHDKKILIGGIGLTLNLRPHSLLGYHLREKAAALCGQKKHVIALGRVKNSPGNRKMLRPLVYDFLKIPLVGAHTQSHDWEMLAIYKTDKELSKSSVKNLLAYFKKQKKIRIEGEIF